MSDTGYQPYCEKCGAPVVWCTCLDDIDWSPEMRSYLGRVRLEQQVKELRVELARRDEELALTEKKLCNIDRSARAEVARRDEIIARLKDAGNELYLKGCRNYLPLGDADWAWRTLMKELE